MVCLWTLTYTKPSYKPRGWIWSGRLNQMVWTYPCKIANLPKWWKWHELLVCWISTLPSLSHASLSHTSLPLPLFFWTVPPEASAHLQHIAAKVSISFKLSSHMKQTIFLSSAFMAHFDRRSCVLLFSEFIFVPQRAFLWWVLDFRNLLLLAFSSILEVYYLSFLNYCY